MTTPHVDTHDGEVWISEGITAACPLLRLSPAAALELAERLRSVAEGLLPPVTPEDIEEWAAQRRAKENAALMENRKRAALEMQSRPPFPPEGPRTSNPTCRGVLRNGFHCLCWRSTRNHPSDLCPMHRKAVEQGEASQP